MKEYNVLIADPAGNITAIVLDQDVERNNYVSIANKLMALELGIEQVGFMKEPVIGGESRLEMMGGEFCGNGARSFGLYLAADSGAGDRMVRIESSGCSGVLEVTASVTKGYADIDMPLPERIGHISLDSEDTLPVIAFEGILHVIAVNRTVSGAMFEKVKKVIVDQYDPEAFGLIYLNKDELKLTPVVYVKTTDTVVYERSCGSGTVAAAIYLTTDCSDGEYHYDLSNPGGGIAVKVSKNKGRVTRANIGGRVVLSEIQSINI